MNKKIVKQLYSLESQLIKELMKNGTEKSQQLFLRWQEKRIELKENIINEIIKLTNSFKEGK